MQVWIVMLYSQDEGWDPGEVHESKEAAYEEAFNYIDSCIACGRWSSDKKVEYQKKFKAEFDEDKDEAIFDWCRYSMDFDFSAYVANRETVPKKIEEKLDESLDADRSRPD